MAGNTHQIRVEKFSLLQDGLDDRLLGAFSDYEKMHPQFGLDWLRNLAAHALDECEQALVFVARLGWEEFVAFPLKLNSKTRQVHSLGNFYTSLYSPIVRSKSPGILFTALLTHLIRVENMAAITLSPMDADGEHFKLIGNSLSRAGWKGIHTFFCFGNWVHDLPEASYQTYLAGRPSRLRNTISRKTRKFLESQRGQLEVLQGSELSEQAIGSFVSVYNNSWKKEEPYPDFIPYLLRLCARRGWLRLGIASYDTKPVACQVWLVEERTAYIFKLAYDQAYRHLSPGTVLTAFLMEHVIEKDAVSRIDYLSGDDEYKTDWMSVRRERHGIAAYNIRTLRGFALLTGHCIKGLYRHFTTKLQTVDDLRRAPEP